MNIILINGSSIPLYEQIRNEVKKNIIEGMLSADMQLPSVRDLSTELNVSILTVKKAYDALEKEGFIIIRQGLGTFVAPLNESLYQDEQQKKMERYLSEACKISKKIDLSSEDFLNLVKFIYEGGTDE